MILPSMLSELQFLSYMLANSRSIAIRLQTLFLGFLWLPAEEQWLHNKRQKISSSTKKKKKRKKSFTKAFMWQGKQHNILFELSISCYGTNCVGSAGIILLHLITALPLHCSRPKTMLDPWILTSKPCKQRKNVKSQSGGFCGAINNKHVCSSISWCSPHRPNLSVNGKPRPLCGGILLMFYSLAILEHHTKQAK